MYDETFVEFETAKLLKEAGFPQVRKLFDGNIEIQKRMAKLMPETAKKDFCATEYHYRIDGTEGVLKSRFDPNTCYAMPSQSVAMRWLRDVHRLLIQAHAETDGLYFDIQDMSDRCYISGFPGLDGNYSTYEAAAEAGIRAACEYLIDNNTKTITHYDNN